jgi:hypothetical protein
MPVSTIAGHNSVLDHWDPNQAVELNSYAYAKETSWARTAEQWLAHLRPVSR